MNGARSILIVFGILFTVMLMLWLVKHMSESFVPQYLFHKSKSFDAERQAIAMYGEQGAWTANPSKTFSAEAQGVEMADHIQGGFIGKSVKFY